MCWRTQRWTGVLLTGFHSVVECVITTGHCNKRMRSKLTGEQIKGQCGAHFKLVLLRAVRYDDIYRMDEIKSLSFHIMFYRLYRGVAKYIVSGNTFSLFEWLWSLYAAHHGAWRRDRSRWRTSSQDTTWSSFLNSACSCVFKHCSFKTTDFKPLKLKQQSYMRALSLSVCEERAFSFLTTLWYQRF